MPRHHPLLPFAATLAAVALYSLMDALMKGAAIAAGAYSALLLRNLVGVALIAPAYLATRRGWPPHAAMQVHALRGVVAAAMAFTFFWGIARVPLAEGIALSFVAPLLALYLAAVLLGERVQRRAVGASLVGLIGVAVILAGRARGEGWSTQSGWGTGAIFVSSALYAWNLVLQRQQAQLGPPVEVAAFQVGMVAVALLLAAPFGFEMPQAATWPAIGASALLSLSAALLLAWSYARAEAQALVPLEYSGFLWASLFGWMLFAEPVGAALLIGVALIVGACWIAAPRRPTEQSAA